MARENGKPLNCSGNKVKKGKRNIKKSSPDCRSRLTIRRKSNTNGITNQGK
jgi:hypothetical protein